MLTFKLDFTKSHFSTFYFLCSLHKCKEIRNMLKFFSFTLLAQCLQQLMYICEKKFSEIVIIGLHLLDYPCFNGLTCGKSKSWKPNSHLFLSPKSF